MFMLLPNGHFLALPPEFWPHWYFWDCACAARMSMVIFSSRVHPAAGACGARERSGVAGGGASAARRRRGHRIGISQRKTIGLFNGRLSALVADMAPHTLWSAMGQQETPALQKPFRRETFCLGSALAVQRYNFPH